MKAAKASPRRRGGGRGGCGNEKRARARRHRSPPFRFLSGGFSNGEERARPTVFWGRAFPVESTRNWNFFCRGRGVDNGPGIARRGEHELDDDARDERVASGRGPLPGGRDGTPSMIAMPGK